MSLTSAPVPEKRPMSIRDALAEKLNDNALSVWDILDDHMDDPTTVLKEILSEIGGQSLYLPVPKTAERVEVWFRVRAGESEFELVDELEEFSDPFEVRRIAGRPL